MAKKNDLEKFLDVAVAISNVLVNKIDKFMDIVERFVEGLEELNREFKEGGGDSEPEPQKPVKSAKKKSEPKGKKK